MTAEAPTGACYVYGVVASQAAVGGTGVGGRPVEAIGAGDAFALASSVPLEEFGEEPLRENLNDRGWLEDTARAHEDVLERALAAGPVVPFRLCTIYRGREQVEELLAGRGADFAALLRELDGTVELGVKAYFEPGRSEAPAVAAQSGRDYLVRRQRERTLAEESASVAAECARASHERLSAVALAARSNPPQARELSGRQERMVLNGAYLVPRDDRALEGVVAELEEEYGESGVSYELTGPWPPYNFVPRDLGES